MGVISEFDKAFEILEKYSHTVTMFGSARLTSEHPSYKMAQAVAARLAGEGFGVTTGGGGGIMEAANRGAYEAGGASIGFNIQLPHEQMLNKFTTDHYTFEHFFARKVCLTLDAEAYIYYAGGFGTLDELFEIMTLVQTGDIPKVPIILVGSDFWLPLAEVFKKTLDETYHTIDPVDVNLYTITDDIDEIVKLVQSHQAPHHTSK